MLIKRMNYKEQDSNLVDYHQETEIFTISNIKIYEVNKNITILVSFCNPVFIQVFLSSGMWLWQYGTHLTDYAFVREQE